MRASAISIIGFLLIALGSCGPATVAINPAIQGDPPGMTVRADWNDVDAAADIAGPQVELAMLSKSLETLPGGMGEHRYMFLATDDTEFDLRVRQAQPGAGVEAPGPLKLTAEGHPRRDPKREATLISAMARRLEDLAGKEWAPVRE